MATKETVELNEPHPPTERAVEAFTEIQPHIARAIIRSRHDWDKHEPRMWARAKSYTDEQLSLFDVGKDLVQVRSAPTPYGSIIFGKIRIPAIVDEQGEAFVHVRIHDPHNRDESDIKFHSILTEEGNKTPEGHPTTWKALFTMDDPLEFFDE